MISDIKSIPSFECYTNLKIMKEDQHQKAHMVGNYFLSTSNCSISKFKMPTTHNKNYNT